MGKRKILWGMFFILAAIIVILHTAGLLAGINPLSILISVLLLPVIFASIPKLNFFGIFFPAAIILILNNDFFGIEKFTPFPMLLTALFLSLGFTLLFPSKKKGLNVNVNFSSPYEADTHNGGQNSKEENIVDIDMN